ncbi:probable extracellular repeat, HAF family [Micromonospora viridifaciens]|uniref:Probable extracellular repeat, HAF family n=1 Tax=Micromonospora viridifaciens TaxID=1881 RepID=A0A1C4VRW9_MICVI|nr:HAF repeat-containing protein [Micromonospora viridifaciens]SCE86774.1 probable extracellular repeat, HAF family [Micromonospora viridifaciens]
MSRLQRTLACLTVVVAGVATTPGIATAATALPTYTYIDLGTIGAPSTGEPPSSDAYALNAAGTVVGVSTIDGIYNHHAFAWTDGVMTDLGAIYSGTFGVSKAEGINDLGVIVGSTHVNETEPGHAFRYADGVMTDLGTGYGVGSGSHANDINDDGTVVGTRFERQGSPTRAVVWRNGTIRDLGTLGGKAGAWGTDSIAYAVNDAGHVVGGAITPSGALHAFVWKGGALQDLGTLGGLTESTYARDINDHGDVVGASQNRSGEVHATLWSAGTVRDLGTLGGNYSEARAVNEAGQVVGISRVSGAGSYTGRAFLWQDGRMIDLNNQVPDLPPTVTLRSAEDVNDDGLIVGFACPVACDAGGDRARRAYLLVPTGLT